jgi:AraC-like DNA-binding protein
VIPARRPHAYYADHADPWSIWWLHLVGEDVADLVAGIGTTPGRPTVPVVDPYPVLALVERICDLLDRDETASTLTAAAGAAWHLLAQLGAERGRRVVADREPVQLVQDHLRHDLGAPVRVSELAELAGFSTSHFAARFRAVTGFSVTEYVKRLRMARARQLLITTDRTVAEIAAVVGYPDPFYFSRQFRAVNGLAPRTFRARSLAEVAPAGPAARPDR